MQKPLTVARQEFMEKLVTAINNCELPAFVVAEVLRNCLTETERFAKQQYEAEKQEWEKSQESKLKSITDEERDAIVRVFDETIKNKEN